MDGEKWKRRKHHMRVRWGYNKHPGFAMQYMGNSSRVPL